MDNPLTNFQSAEEDLTEQMASFGNHILARRKALKLTQKDVSLQFKKEEAVPISLSYFHDMEVVCTPTNDP